MWANRQFDRLHLPMLKFRQMTAPALLRVSSEDDTVWAWCACLGRKGRMLLADTGWTRLDDGHQCLALSVMHSCHVFMSIVSKRLPGCEATRLRNCWSYISQASAKYCLLAAKITHRYDSSSAVRWGALLITTCIYRDHASNQVAISCTRLRTGRVVSTSTTSNAPPDGLDLSSKDLLLSTAPKISGNTWSKSTNSPRKILSCTDLGTCRFPA